MIVAKPFKRFHCVAWMLPGMLTLPGSFAAELFDNHCECQELQTELADFDRLARENPVGTTTNKSWYPGVPTPGSLVWHLLEEQPEIKLVAQAAEFKQTISLTRKFKRQVVIMDVHMPKSLEFTPLDVSNRLHSADASIPAISVWNDSDN